MLMIPANLPKCPSCRMALGHLPDCQNNDADQSEPLTCSEVVERLAECVYGSDDTCGLQLDKAEAILHSWRERRVQELEELIAKRSGCSHCNDSASGSTSANDPTESRKGHNDVR